MDQILNSKPMQNNSVPITQREERLPQQLNTGPPQFKPPQPPFIAPRQDDGPPRQPDISQQGQAQQGVDLGNRDVQDSSTQNAQAKPTQAASGRFCIYCGTGMAVGYDAKIFCPKCGYKPDEPGQKTQGKETGHEASDTKDKIFFYLKILMWIALAGLVVYVAFMFVDSMGDIMSIF